MKSVSFSKKIQILGHIIDKPDIKSNHNKVLSIQKLRDPENLKDLRTFLGLINKMGRFSFKIEDLTKPLRDLLSKSSIWTCYTPQRQAFLAVKEECVLH